jgi:hypothetical protein
MDLITVTLLVDLSSQEVVRLEMLKLSANVNATARQLIFHAAAKELDIHSCPSHWVISTESRLLTENAFNPWYQLEHTFLNGNTSILRQF